jgi:hypothetical protein
MSWLDNIALKCQGKLNKIQEYVKANLLDDPHDLW